MIILQSTADREYSDIFKSHCVPFGNTPETTTITISPCQCHHHPPHPPPQTSPRRQFLDQFQYQSFQALPFQPTIANLEPDKRNHKTKNQPPHSENTINTTATTTVTTAAISSIQSDRQWQDGGSAAVARVSIIQPCVRSGARCVRIIGVGIV